MQVHATSFPFLTSLLLCCGLGLAIILLLPAHREREIKLVSAVFSGLTLVISLYLYLAYDRDLGGQQFAESWEWVPALGIRFANAADGFSLPMLLLTGIVFFTAVLTAWELNYRVKEFFALTFLLVLGVFGLFMSLDLFFIFVWFDVSLFPMYLLIAIWGSTRKEYGAMKLTLYLLAGSALILPAILYLVVGAGLSSFSLITLMQEAVFSPGQQRLAFLLLYIGFGILAGVWPFHTWSPVGHVAAPTAVSMIHAGVLMKIGAFGILRVGIYLCPEGWSYWSPVMAFLATAGIVYGALVGLSQTDLKYVIGYSSVSHMGIVGLGLATLTVDGLSGAVYQMFAHGIMTALFFSSVGYIYDRTHTKAIADLGGLGRTLPRASSFFILAAMTGIGVPCLASFWGELVVFLSAVRVFPIYGALVVLALVISALFMLRVVQKTCYGPPLERYAGLDDMGNGAMVPRLILAAVIIGFGLFPGALFDMINSAAIPFIEGVLG
ncbi:MAG: NADH-quinone oxidoreductase subunit M [Desulfosarcinaceae bacterium]|nr:NADH-quinone oxidoreductase subunit M [Desulfosarcinaceae bacterium]